jgi:hypothetical protein
MSWPDRPGTSQIYSRKHSERAARTIFCANADGRNKFAADCVARVSLKRHRNHPAYVSVESGGWVPTRSATPSTALVPQRKVGFPIPNAGLLLGFQGTKTARREGISSPFSDAGGCTSPQNSGECEPERENPTAMLTDELLAKRTDQRTVSYPIPAALVRAVSAETRFRERKSVRLWTIPIVLQASANG